MPETEPKSPFTTVLPRYLLIAAVVLRKPRSVHYTSDVATAIAPFVTAANPVSSVTPIMQQMRDAGWLEATWEATGPDTPGAGRLAYRVSDGPGGQQMRDALQYARRALGVGR